jgi:hypothetical protein
VQVVFLRNKAYLDSPRVHVDLTKESVSMVIGPGGGH